LVTARRDVRTDAVVALARVAEREPAVLPALLEADAETVARAVNEAKIRRHVADVVVHVAERHRRRLAERVLRGQPCADAPLEAAAREHRVVVVRARIELPAAGFP